jgi:hypothetical protein
VINTRRINERLSNDISNPEDLRNEWLEYLKRKSCVIMGARAGIKKATSEVLIKALREELEKEI